MILPNLRKAELREREFQFLRDLIEKKTGIFLNEGKNVLLESRLQRRLWDLNLESFEDYCELLADPVGFHRELPRLIDAITTNKTDFFREPGHFDYLENRIILPGLQNGTISRPYKVWSSACSSGEEVYTLAIVLDRIRRSNPQFDFSVLGTDISEAILKTARDGIYESSRIYPISDELRNTYFLKGVNTKSRFVKFKDEYKTDISFGKLNLTTEISRMREQFDVIFCRNVLIYFSKETQYGILKNMHDRLTDGGILILGHSETVTGMELPYTSIGPSIYRKS